MAIHVYNINDESHDFDKNNYFIGRPSILGNPYTHIKDRSTLAMYVVKDRDTAIDNYKHYFDIMYDSNVQFKETIDEIYEKYRNGEEIYLGCFCHPLRCHGDIIKEKLQNKLIKEKINERYARN